MYEGVFFILANSPSAASNIDFNIKKKAAAQKYPSRIQIIEIKPEIINAIVT